MNRRIPSFVVGGIGVVLILIALAARLFTAAPAFESLTDNFRPEMRSAELSRLRTDVNNLAAVQSEFTTKAVPQLAAAAKMTPQQFVTLLGQQYPAVAAGLQSVPTVTQQFTGVLNVLDAEQARFTKADRIPTKSLPATTVPWALVGAGGLCIVAAFFVPRRRGAAAALVLGTALVVAPLALSLPSKAGAADTMNSHLKPVYTAELVSGAKSSLAGMQAMGSELQTKLIPGLAQLLHQTPQQLQGYLGSNFPAVAAGVASMPDALGRFDRLVTTFDSSLTDYNRAKKTTLVPIVWALLIAGLLVTGTAGFVLVGSASGAVAGREEHGRWRERLAAAMPGHGHLSHR
ncbi:MAG TPA: hypothetical protein VHL53_15835 [Acidimicrobiia bacterium]|nr:hypothetical protein [Acidimicrobiia bacterium]